MGDDSEKYFLYIDGHKVPVSEQIFKEYQYFERKERYYSVDLKTEGFICDQEAKTAKFTPSREDSYERLLELNHQFPSPDIETAEDAAIKSVMIERLHDAMATLTDDEMVIIREFYFLSHTERQISLTLKIAASTLRDRKHAILRKLRNFVDKFS